jgi:predicted MFS family arabinose efflux permease
MGVVGSLIAAAAMLTGSFAGLCVGTFVIGVYNALAQFLRFAAADVADAFDPAAKERAVSWVMAGGIAGGIVGPQLSKLTRDLFPAAFAGSFLALAAAAAVALMLSRGLRIRDDDAAAAQPARPLAQIAVQPAFFVAVLVGAVGFGVMNLLMNASPLAMAICGFGYPDAADAIQWHVIAMFAPGFFTGALIQRFGLHPVMLCGCAAMLGTAAIGSLGTGYWHFWSALVLLGLGWNLMFTGATLLLMRSYRPGEKAKAQGANNLAVSLLQIAASAAAGALVSTRGWAELNLLAAPPIALAGAAIIGLSLHRGRPRVTAAAPADAGARCGR